MSLLVVGSIALDTVKTPVEEHADLLGGSASYAALGASFFSPVKLVGVVGDDFPASEFEFWKSHRIDTHWSATGQRENFSLVRRIRLGPEHPRDAFGRAECFRNVFPGAAGKLSRHTDFVLLANIAPKLQLHVLDQMERPRFVVADTMDLWIETTRADLDALLRRVDLLILNDSEAREMTKETSLIRAGRKIRGYGPRYVAIKKGEHGALLFGEDEFFSCRRLSAGRYSRSDRGRGHFCRRFRRLPGGARTGKRDLRCNAQGGDLWKCAGEFLCGSV